MTETVRRYRPDLGEIAETRLSCGHTATFCESCYREQRQWVDWEAWCQKWERTDVIFAVNTGHVLHTLRCVDARGPDRVSLDELACGHLGSEPLTLTEAAAWLRESHERRRCMRCAPDIQEPGWIKVGRHWRLAEESAQ